MRKKNLSLAMLAACAGLLLAGASCKKGGDGSVAPATEAAFTATAETHTGNGKTHLYNNEDEHNVVRWDANDEIVVYNNGGDHYTFAATRGESSSTEFESTDATDAFYEKMPYNAFYPSAGATYSADKWSWTLPEIQKYEENGFAKDANPMAAKSEDNNLYFMNVCGLLELRLYGEGFTVKSITVSSDEEVLSGAGTVSWEGEGDNVVPVFEVGDGGSKSVTLTCSEEEGGGVTLSAGGESTYTPFYVVLPAGTLEEEWFTVEVEYVDGAVRRRAQCSTTGTGIQRSKIRPMRAFECNVISATDIELDRNVTGLVMEDKPTVTLTATVTPHNSTDKVRWTSDNEGVATVDENGNVTAKGKGQATITATVNGHSAECIVTVAPKGAIPGLFSVSEDNQVYFSKGNLTYSVTDHKWAFYGNQYDYNPLGYDANLISLFCWGWSSNSIDPDDYTNNGTFSDWGVQEAVINGIGSGWRTLTKDEWVYLLNVDEVESGARNSGWARFARVRLKGIQGLLIFPDGLLVSSDNKITIGGVEVANVNVNGSFSTYQVIADAEWVSLDGNGVVFLPCAGDRDGTSVHAIGARGYYWSSSPYSSDANYAYCLLFFSDYVDPANYNGRNRFFGRSVRLVCP